jgi:hypothetical protein
MGSESSRKFLHPKIEAECANKTIGKTTRADK